jgi:hypothetical protein
MQAEYCNLKIISSIEIIGIILDLSIQLIAINTIIDINSFNCNNWIQSKLIAKITVNCNKYKEL